MDADSFRLFLALALIALSAFFSGSETALFSLSHTKLAEIEQKGGASARRIKHLLAHPRHTLVSVLIGNELVNVAFSAVMAGMTLHIGLGRTTSIVLTTLVILLFGEITPKSIALTFPVGYSKFVAQPLSMWYRLVAPVRVVLREFADFVSGLWSVKSESDTKGLDEEALLHLLEEGRREGVIEQIESEIIKRTLALDDVFVEEIMTPKERIFYLPEDASLQQILQALKEHRFSRIPIMDRTGSFIGIFFSRDLLPYLKKPESFTGIRELARPPHYVSSRSRVYDLLRDFRSRKKHMAFVRDERGEVIGLVTLDDILESLFKLESKAKSGVQK